MTFTSYSFLLQIAPLDRSAQAPTGVAADMLRTMLAVSGLCVLLVLWAVIYVRRRRRHRRHHHHTPPTPVDHRHPVDTEGGESPEEGDPPSEEDRHRGHRRRRRRRRRRHGEFRERNPTLAETGGLPPLRDGSHPNPPA
jgi:hypothetical protein